MSQGPGPGQRAPGGQGGGCLQSLQVGMALKQDIGQGTGDGGGRAPVTLGAEPILTLASPGPRQCLGTDGLSRMGRRQATGRKCGREGIKEMRAIKGKCVHVVFLGNPVLFLSNFQSNTCS